MSIPKVLNEGKAGRVKLDGPCRGLAGSTIRGHAKRHLALSGGTAGDVSIVESSYVSALALPARIHAAAFAFRPHCRHIRLIRLAWAGAIRRRGPEASVPASASLDFAISRNKCKNLRYWSGRLTRHLVFHAGSRQEARRDWRQNAVRLALSLRFHAGPAGWRFAHLHQLAPEPELLSFNEDQHSDRT